MRREDIIIALRNSLKEIWGYTSGKAGILLLVWFIATSLYALAVMPSDFKARWNNPIYWQEYPQYAPPEWVRSLGQEKAKHFVAKFESPSARDPQIQEYNYTAEYVLDTNDFPQSIVAVIKGVHVPEGEHPAMLVRMYLLRPDGQVFKLFDSVKDLNITAGNTTFSVLFTEQPYKIEKDNNLLHVQFVKLYGSPLEHQEHKALFGTVEVVKEGNETTYKIEPLKGTYKVVLSIRFIGGEVTTDKPIDKVDLVVVGNCYGLMGTDDRGRDLAKGLLYGFPVALAIGLVTAVASTIIGLFAGVISGYYGGWIDEGIQRLIDIMGSIPLLPFLILLVDITPQEQRLTVIMLVLIVFGWGGLAIIVRSMSLSIKSELYVEAAKAVGASNRRIIFKHIVPQIMPYITATLVFSVPGAVLSEAGLSVIGLEHGWPTWGRILADARAKVSANQWYWWWLMPPGILLALMSLTFVLLGMAIETIVEPRLRKKI